MDRRRKLGRTGLEESPTAIFGAAFAYVHGSRGWELSDGAAKCPRDPQRRHWTYINDIATALRPATAMVADPPGGHGS